MRLLLLDQFSDPGGAQQGLLELLPEILRRGWKVMVGIPGEGELFARIAALGVRAERITCGPYRSGSKSLVDAARFAAGTPVLASQVRRLARAVDAQVVYVNGPRLLPGAAMAGLNVPLVFHSHSYLFPGMSRRLAIRALQSSRAWLIGSCHFVAEPYLPFVAPERQSIIYNGVAGPAQVQRPAGGPPVVACVGRIAPEKGQREFVAAASMIRKQVPDCRFVIYGAALFAEAGAQQYDREVRAAGEREGVEFRGWVTDIHAALSQTHLLLVPSMAHEATTRVILEAHAGGVPVVAFRSGGIPEVVEHGRDGWLADSCEEMAAIAVDLLHRSPANLADISRDARDSWSRKFSLQRYHDQLLGALERAGAG